jgi:hypothetical protein
MFASHFVLPYFPEATNTTEASQALRNGNLVSKNDHVLAQFGKLRTELKKALLLRKQVFPWPMADRLLGCEVTTRILYCCACAKTRK